MVSGIYFVYLSEMTLKQNRDFPQFFTLGDCFVYTCYYRKFCSELEIPRINQWFIWSVDGSNYIVSFINLDIQSIELLA